MSKSIKPSPFVKDVFFTAITSGTTILSIIIVVRLLAQGLGVEGFGAYSLARRFLSILSPLSTLAMGVAIARYVALSKDDKSKNLFLWSGTIIIMFSSLSIMLIGFIFKNQFSKLIFHNSFYISLFLATLFMNVGYSFYSNLYSFYRGIGKMGKANILQLLIMAIGPILIALLFSPSKRVDLIIFLMGLISFSVIFPLIFYIYPVWSERYRALSLKFHLKELLSYGLPRVPGGFAFNGIFAIGPFLAPTIGSLKGAGYLVIGQSLFRVIEGAVEAFGIVALPKVAQIHSDEKTEFLKDRISDIISFVFHLGLFIMLQLIIWSDRIVLAWLGNEYTETTSLITIYTLSLVPYLSFSFLRSVIDAIQKKAVTAHITYVSFIVTLIVSLIFIRLGLGVPGLACGLTVGFYVLGFLTIHYLWKFYRLNWKNLLIKYCLLLNVTFFLAGILFKHWSQLTFSGIQLYIFVAIFEGILFTFYLLILWKLKALWITELINRIH